MTFSSNVLSIEKQGQVGIIWLDRESKYNALSTELWSAIPHALAALCEDVELGAIVLAGRGKHFCAGIDLAEDGLSQHKKAKARSKAEANIRQLSNTQKFQQAISSLAECELPVIAVVQGFCLGAGVDLITACDIRVASADSVFSVRETRLGLVADVGTLQRPKQLALE